MTSELPGLQSNLGGTYKGTVNNGMSVSSVDDNSQVIEDNVKTYSYRDDGGDSDAEISCCAPETSPGKVLLKIALCILAGFVFGWSLEKGRVFEPASIRLQMVFRRWVMLKMFVAAMGSGMLVLGLMSLLPVLKTRLQEAMHAFGCCLGEKGLVTTCLGPFILGVGMTLTGACPGMVLAQVGSWTQNSVYTLIGVLIGTLMYGVVAPWIIRLTRPKTPFTTLTLHDKLGIRYALLAIPMSLMVAVVVFLMEYYIPWQEDLDCWNRNAIATPDSGNIFTLKSWPPGVAGALIGLMQLPIVISVADSLGGSSSYVTIMSQWVVGHKLTSLFPYLAKARCGLGNWWQVFYVLAAVGGAAVSSATSESIGSAEGVSIPAALFGGVLLLVGARLAAGCTSGHGLSGVGLLYWLSFLAVPCMFGGGIVTAFIMDATGALSDYHCHGDVCNSYVPAKNCDNFTST